MAAAVYTVRTTLNPGVTYDVSAAEFEQLTDQGLISSLDAVTVPADQVLVVDAMPTTPPLIGTVIFNRSVPA